MKSIYIRLPQKLQGVIQRFLSVDKRLQAILADFRGEKSQAIQGVRTDSVFSVKVNKVTHG